MTVKRGLAVVTALATTAAMTGGGCAGPTEPAPAMASRAEVAVPWSWEMPACAGYQPGDYASPGYRVEVRTREVADLLEQVETYEPGWAAVAVADIRSVLDACASYEAGGSGDPAAFREQHLIVETGFAGDDSLLVEVVRQQPPDWQVSYAVVVRRGEEVTTVRAPETGLARAACHAVLATCREEFRRPAR